MRREMRAGEWKVATAENLRTERKPKFIPRAENVPSLSVGVPEPRPSQNLSAECCLFQSPMSLLGVGECEAEKAHACPEVGMGLDFMWDLPNSGRKAMASPLLGFLSLPRSPSRPGCPGSPGCPAMTEGKERPEAPGGPAGPWRPGKPAENK